MAPVRDMYQKKIDELFQGLPNVFSIADDILIAGFSDMIRDHDAMLNKVLRKCRKANLKLNKDKYLFKCTSIPIFSEIILKSNVRPDPRKIQALKAMPLPKCKKELKSSLGIINYLSTFSQMTAEVCEPLWNVISIKIEWSWNGRYQDLIIKQDACIKIYGTLKTLCPETDASSISMGGNLLQVRDGMNYKQMRF